MSSQSHIVLNGYTFPTNPIDNNYDLPISASYTETWNGGYISVFGEFVQDQTFNYTFPVLNYAQYQQLESIKATCAGGSTVSHVSAEGLSCTVFMMELTKGSLIPGSLSAYSGVKCILRVVSIP